MAGPSQLGIFPNLGPTLGSGGGPLIFAFSPRGAVEVETSCGFKGF